MTDNSNKFDSLQERNEQVLNNISQLQSQEKDLYVSLDNVSLTPEQKQNIINRINEISQIRMNLYAGLKEMYSHYRENVSASRSTLGQSVAAIDILENELNESKMRLNLINDQKSNKLRLVEINTYFGKRYNAHSKLMKTIVIICIPVIILTVLANKGILPLNIYKLITGIILAIGTVIIGLQLIDISYRDNMNWDEYEWYFDEADAPSSEETTEETTEENPWKTESATCVGSECCYEGSTYDYEKNICVPNTSYEEENPETTETFKGLGKYAYAQLNTTPFNNKVFPLFAPLSNF